MLLPKIFVAQASSSSRTLWLCRVTIENDTNASATVVKVDSDNRHDILLNVVQLFTDLELTIKKCDIFSDGGWFFDGEF